MIDNDHPTPPTPEELDEITESFMTAMDRVEQASRYSDAALSVHQTVGRADIVGTYHGEQYAVLSEAGGRRTWHPVSEDEASAHGRRFGWERVAAIEPQCPRWCRVDPAVHAEDLAHVHHESGELWADGPGHVSIYRYDGNDWAGAEPQAGVYATLDGPLSPEQARDLARVLGRAVRLLEDERPPADIF